MTIITRVLSVMTVALLVTAASPVFAETSPAPTAAASQPQIFGVVDMQKVLHETKAAKGIFDEIESRRKEYQSQISKEEDTLRAAEKDILKQKDTLSKDDFDKKRKEFEKRVLDGQQMVQDHKQTLDRVFNESMAKLREQAAEIVAGVAKERGYSAVFTQDSVMLSVPEMDMTDDVVKRMNDKVGQIKVDWSAGGQNK